MAQTPIVRASNMVKVFIRNQKAAGLSEIFNFNNAKWSMHDIMEQIDDDRQVSLLIEYFFLVSEKKTWYDFLYNYQYYLESFEETKIAYAQRAYLQAQTIKRSTNT